ncbi:RNA 2'-phosphotransferase [Streptacidiphilus sp. P02-A3a]|uniref:RNA 2'-phosphotransferase n=1 Tax=Streptacidiphilus sp. P02-A3a TaxID=2704468 RepID=UPI0015FE4988|nr:RNA 2'-phosphotransferase [Streptacidiphilus sp. P02-A3a]QMU72669.1 RNA 2'-phosphotransferase [Streptacidiphilus sp. P02-A3a]
MSDSNHPEQEGAPLTPQTQNPQLVKRSRFLSLVLRHDPARIGLTLDPAGWTDVGALLDALAAHGRPLSRAQLDQVVAENDKQRFAFDPSGTRIRANQGHSVRVDLGLPEAEPPSPLFHGTHPGALAAIRREGLRPMRRHDVHLSADRETAARVGARRGRAVVLTVDAARMAAAGHRFRVSGNGVWLASAVPPEYLGGW